MHDIKLEYWT